MHRALENTLQVMNGRNEKFRKSLTRADSSSELTVGVYCCREMVCVFVV